MREKWRRILRAIGMFEKFEEMSVGVGELYNNKEFSRITSR